MSETSTEPDRAFASASTLVACDRVVELFGTHPPSWIRPVLTLTSPVDEGARAGRPSFELGRPSVGADAVTVPLTWCPDRGPRTFQRFVGCFGLRPGRPGTILTLEGTVEGGEQATNQAALDAALRRVVRALEEAYPAG